MAWFDELHLPGATIEGFFGYVTSDGSDGDDFPDVLLGSGTIKFAPTTPAARVEGTWLGIEPVTARIFEGRVVVSEENPIPVRILATDANIGVADWAWKATFDIAGFKLEPLTFKAPRGTTVNLTDDLMPIKSQPYQIIEGASIIGSENDLSAGLIRFKLSNGSFTPWMPGVGERGPRGLPGVQGDKGNDGTSAQLSMGSVTEGSAADAWMTGTPLNRELNLTLPRGIKGDKGDDGPPGATVTRTAPGVYAIEEGS